MPCFSIDCLSVENWSQLQNLGIFRTSNTNHDFIRCLMRINWYEISIDRHFILLAVMAGFFHSQFEYNIYYITNN